MQTNTKIRKSRDGKWQAETLFPLPEIPTREDMGRTQTPFLKLASYAQRGQITHTYSVEWHALNSITFMVFGDFFVRVPFTPAARVTEKLIVEAHKIALGNFEEMRTRALSFYNNPKSGEAA